MILLQVSSEVKDTHWLMVIRSEGVLNLSYTELSIFLTQINHFIIISYVFRMKQILVYQLITTRESCRIIYNYTRNTVGNQRFYLRKSVDNRDFYRATIDR